MPRLVHATTGVTVEVSDETAELLGSEWSAAEATKAEAEADEKPTTRRKSN